MSEIKRILLECAVVGVFGVAVGLAANAMNPDGLALGRDYFRMAQGHSQTGPQTRPASKPAALPGAVTTTVADVTSAGGATDVAASSRVSSNAASSEADAVRQQVLQILEEWGLAAIEHEEVVALYESPWRAEGVYIFIDARDDDHYHDGHIPGAYQLDHYFIDRYIDEVLPACTGAEKIVLYCNGGDCEDSRLAADELRSTYGIDPAKLFVYVDGATMWKKQGLPVEKGTRGSGDVVEGGQ